MPIFGNLFRKEKEKPASDDSKPTQNSERKQDQPFDYKKHPRIAEMKMINEQWIGIAASKKGDAVIELYGSKKIPVGEWLYFAFQIKTQPDHRLIFSDSACFWLNIPDIFTIKDGSNMFRPIPEEIDPFIIQDGNYTEWKNAFQAVDDYFSNSEVRYGWRNQWSWKTGRVKQFMAGQCLDWISTRCIEAETKTKNANQILEK
jgi:hypothetical protein